MYACVLYLGEKKESLHSSAFAQIHARHEIVRLRYNYERDHLVVRPRQQKAVESQRVRRA